MSELKVSVKYLGHHKGLTKPQYQTPGAAGMDLVAANEQDIIIEPGKFALVPTGISLEIPSGFEAQVRPRSGLALNYGITVLNSPGTIDSDYRGEIKVILINLGVEKYIISRGMRIAQLVVNQVTRIILIESEAIMQTERNTGGFGHTGV
ncbi:MAG: dUTP diphosphatase [Desulfitobacteriaceae bacterium]|nr:dUTP diphosphatase [Desulfitobacteriaceae bacterium]MDD4751783.1 dUTP diphosphatase [Desulfitobacteriaceae bacterium]